MIEVQDTTGVAASLVAALVKTTERCGRCGAAFASAGDGWSTMMQVIDDEPRGPRFVGFIVCGRCVGSFSEWVMSGRLQ